MELKISNQAGQILGFGLKFLRISMVVIFAFVVLATVFAAFAGGGRLIVQGQTAETADFSKTIETQSDVEFDGYMAVKQANVSIEIDAKHQFQNVSLLGYALLGLGFIFIAVSNIVALLDRSYAGHVFVNDNVQNLLYAGWALLGIALLSFFFRFFVAAVIDPLEFEGPDFVVVNPMSPWPFLVAGLFVLTIAGVFSKGVKLKEFDEAAI